MKQFAYEITDSAELDQQLHEAAEYVTKHPHSAVLAHIYSGYTDRGRMRAVIGVLKEQIPDIQVAGLTSGGEIHGGKLVACTTTVIITVFDTTRISVHCYQVNPGEEAECGREIQKTIDSTLDVKAAELLVDCKDISTAVMFPEINKCAPQVKLFGAVPYAHNLNEPMYVFTDEALESATVVLIIFAGDDFHIATDYVIGWKPMGVAMHATKVSGSVLNELDGKPALEVYDKYLKIPNDEHFYQNAFEFPFLRYSHDLFMMRLPHAGLPDGSIELRAPVKEGDILYLSYGDMPTIVDEVLNARGRLERFHPQNVILHNCATRKTFWGDGIDREIEPFQALAPTDGLLTGGEILRVNGHLVHFNATLAIIGVREGMPNENELLRMRERNLDETTIQQTTMVRRMAYFINVAMQELLESNRQLDILAKTDELTSLFNRRELSRIANELHKAKKPFSLLMADIDDFKSVNDTYGHDVGDRVLQGISELIRLSIADVNEAAAGRWGGEEFMVLLPATDAEHAKEVAEGLRERIEEFNFGRVKLTISLGVVDSATYHDMRQVYHDVDQALYAAKDAGKNMVVSAGLKE